MMVQDMSQRMEELRAYRPQQWPNSPAVQAGLTLILADAARSHLQAGDVETATLCVAEAERCLAILRSRQGEELSL